MTDIDPIVVDDCHFKLRPLCLACHIKLPRSLALTSVRSFGSCTLCGCRTCYRAPAFDLAQLRPAQQSLPPSTTAEQGDDVTHDNRRTRP